MRISNSFSEGEIAILDFILQTLLRGGSPQMATRNMEFASLYRKVVTMKTRVAEKKEEKEQKLRSSVGTIAAQDGVDAATGESLDQVG
ncbi:MAG: hypothetical protein AAGH15_12635 [Myxococcota bacterium]